MKKLLLAALLALAIPAAARAQWVLIENGWQYIQLPNPVSTGSVISDTIWDAAGDLAVGTGADTAARLAKGSDGDVLTMTAGAVGWVAASGGAPTSATYITETANGSLSAEFALGSLATGLLKNTTTTGVPSIYAGTSCTNQFARSLDASGAATCASVANADITASTIDLTTKVTGTLPIANGGTNLTAATDDNVMVGNGTTWQSKALTTCTDVTGNHLNYDASTNTFSCGTSAAGVDPTTTIDKTEEFMGRSTTATGTCASGSIVNTTVNSGGTAPTNNESSTTVTGSRTGVCQWETGTSAAAGTSEITSSLNVDLFALAETLEISTCLVGPASTGNDLYKVRAGYSDVVTLATPTDGCYFEYTDTVNSGNWTGTCTSNSSPTVVNTSVAPTICPTYQLLKIDINSNATSVTFSTDGTPASGGAITTAGSIPTGAGRHTGINVGINKSGGIGTNSRAVAIDYIRWRKTVSR